MEKPEKQILKIVITTTENNVRIVIDVDKEKFHKIIEPFLMIGLQKINAKPSE